MGTFTLETMQIQRPSLIRSPTRSGGTTSFFLLTSRRSMISPHVPLLLLLLESIWHLGWLRAVVPISYVSWLLLFIRNRIPILVGRCSSRQPAPKIVNVPMIDFASPFMVPGQTIIQLQLEGQSLDDGQRGPSHQSQTG